MNRADQLWRESGVSRRERIAQRPERDAMNRVDQLWRERQRERERETGVSRRVRIAQRPERDEMP